MADITAMTDDLGKLSPPRNSATHVVTTGQRGPTERVYGKFTTRQAYMHAYARFMDKRLGITVDFNIEPTEEEIALTVSNHEMVAAAADKGMTFSRNKATGELELIDQEEVEDDHLLL